MEEYCVSIDIGSGAVKAVSEDDKRFSFRSVLAPVREDEFDGLFKDGLTNRVNLCMCSPKGDGEKREWLYGGLAAKSSMAMVSLSYETFERSPVFHDTLVFTAAALLCQDYCEENDAIPLALGLGVPLAVYKKGKDVLKKRLVDMTATVRINGGDERHLAISRLEVYPQGAAVVLAQNRLPDGLTGIIDVGKYTTDILLMDVVNGKLSVLGDEYRASLPVGSYLVDRAIMNEFRKQTGKPLELVDSESATKKALEGQALTYNGEKIFLQRSAQKAIEETARTIIQGITSTWGSKISSLENTITAGGGALLFGDILSASLPNVNMDEDPVYSNALGYLRVLKHTINK